MFRVVMEVFRSNERERRVLAALGGPRVFDPDRPRSET
ncbi:hypothetical protein B005_4697 [Nocardiopsis alba ATCC BAA-2165]|uniref:Uncharacterized protein n=1 Tax=Nocardiopsis alba (strain ATCC BAA-2165 / BE74) TaxID=1205910 RepID=J7LBC8_NOCAA|nr:hypothetical protein B005_4697 [Nocardiopsis alba ATCC BAA-2165]